MLDALPASSTGKILEAPPGGEPPCAAHRSDRRPSWPGEASDSTKRHGGGDRRGRLHRRRDRQESSPPRGSPSSPAGATATSSRRWSPTSRRAGGRIFGRSLDARKEEDITAFLQEADRAGAARSLHLQHRRQRQFPDPRHDRARLPQGLGDGLLLGLPRRPRGGAPDAAARPGLHLLHRRHRQHARRHRLRRLRQRPSSACARWRRPLARELGPKNIHVAHLVIDSGVDTAWVRERIKAREGAEALPT